MVVLDENDHAPKFPQKFLNTSVAESADVGSQLIQIQAFDLDASNPSALAQTEVAVFFVFFCDIILNPQKLWIFEPLDYGFSLKS